MMKILQLVALVSCISKPMFAYFETNTAQNVLGLVPITIDLGDHIKKLSSLDELDLTYFNNTLHRKITLALVECEGKSAHTHFKRLYRKLLLNILIHANWQTRAGSKIRQNHKSENEAHEQSSGDKDPNDGEGPIRQEDEENDFEELVDEEVLEQKNHDQIDKSQCKQVSNAFLSVPQINGMKQKIDARITKTVIDWLKENQIYVQVGWQFLLWGSGITEWYYGDTQLLPHLIAYSSIYLRALFSAAPVAIQAYHAFSRPLNPQELANMAVRLQTMSSIKVKIADYAKLEKGLSERSLLIDSLRTRDTGLVYERYLRLKKFLISLVESNPEAIYDEDPKRGWPQGPQSYDASYVPPRDRYDDSEQRYENFPQQPYEGHQYQQYPQHPQPQTHPRFSGQNHGNNHY